MSILLFGREGFCLDRATTAKFGPKPFELSESFSGL